MVVNPNTSAIFKKYHFKHIVSNAVNTRISGYLRKHFCKLSMLTGVLSDNEVCIIADGSQSKPYGSLLNHGNGRNGKGKNPSSCCLVCVTEKLLGSENRTSPDLQLGQLRCCHIFYVLQKSDDS